MYVLSQSDKTFCQSFDLYNLQGHSTAGDYSAVGLRKPTAVMHREMLTHVS